MFSSSFRFESKPRTTILEYFVNKKENSPAVYFGLTPGGDRGLPWFREEFRLFFILFYLKSAECNFFDVCKAYYK